MLKKSILTIAIIAMAMFSCSHPKSNEKSKNEMSTPEVNGEQHFHEDGVMHKNHDEHMPEQEDFMVNHDSSALDVEMHDHNNHEGHSH